MPDELAKLAAETICEVASPNWKPGDFEFDALTVARAYLTERKAREPTREMLVAARDWSRHKFGKPIGNEDATGCWQIMWDAAS